MVVVGNSTTELLLLVCSRLGHTREAVTGTRTSVPTSSSISKLRLTLCTEKKEGRGDIVIMTCFLVR